MADGEVLKDVSDAEVRRRAEVVVSFIEGRAGSLLDKTVMLDAASTAGITDNSTNMEIQASMRDVTGQADVLSIVHALLVAGD